MKKRLKISVERPDRNAPGSFVRLYCNEIFIDDGVTFDYAVVLKAMSCLYPYEDAIVTFSIM